MPPPSDTRAVVLARAVPHAPLAGSGTFAAGDALRAAAAGILAARSADELARAKRLMHRAMRAATGRHRPVRVGAAAAGPTSAALVDDLGAFCTVTRTLKGPN